MSITQQPDALNLEEFRAKVTHAAREPLLARVAELEAQLSATPPAQEGWCDGCSPDNCCGCGPAAPAKVQPEPSTRESGHE